MEGTQLSEHLVGRHARPWIVERLLDHPNELWVERLRGRLRLVVLLVRGAVIFRGSSGLGGRPRRKAAQGRGREDAKFV